ncbi:MAG: APC family permease [Desulfobacterales bacterium]|nr:APC family permease [Desulfobacterales bacterium]
MTSLKKVLKLKTVVSTAAGMAMATSCYLAGLQVAIIVAGELAWISILVAGALCLLAAMCFSELTSLYPSAAGIKLFMENAFNEKTAIAIGMFYVILGISMVGAESYLLSSVLLETVGVIIHPLADRFLWQIVFVLLVGYINVRGVRVTGRVQDFLTYTMLGFLVAVSLYTFTVCDVDMGAALASPRFTLENVFMAAAVGVFMYVGFEWVTPIAEETEDYRMVGRGMMIAVGILSVTYALFVVAMYAGLTEAQLRSGTVIPHILFARNLFGPVGAALFIVMSILASVTSFNAGLLNTSRFSYAMARDNVLPRWFAKLHPEHATPWTSILALMVFAAVLSLVIAVSGQYLFIIVMAAALECFIYVVMAVCVIRLRKKYPGRDRAYRIPFGKTLPVVTAVAFFLLMVGLLADSTRDYAGNVVFHNGWVALAMAIFGGLCVVYTLAVVPKFKRAAAARSAGRKRRRPPRKRTT